MEVVRIGGRRGRPGEGDSGGGGGRRLLMSDTLVEVRAVCPDCGSDQFWSYRSEARVVYRRCLACGCKAKCYRVTTAEVVSVEMRSADDAEDRR